jgi:DNA-directed RNA polymerase subunit RPC12/RpoP
VTVRNRLKLQIFKASAVMVGCLLLALASNYYQSSPIGVLVQMLLGLGSLGAGLYIQSFLKCPNCGARFHFQVFLLNTRCPICAIAFDEPFPLTPGGALQPNLALGPVMRGPLKCSLCKGVLERGHVEIQDTYIRFELRKLSSQHLWFTADARASKRRVLESDEWRRAYRCRTCSAVVVPGLRPPQGPPLKQAPPPSST